MSSHLSRQNYSYIWWTKCELMQMIVFCQASFQWISFSLLWVNACAHTVEKRTSCCQCKESGIFFSFANNAWEKLIFCQDVSGPCIWEVYCCQTFQNLYFCCSALLLKSEVTFFGKIVWMQLHMVALCATHWPLISISESGTWGYI